MGIGKQLFPVLNQPAIRSARASPASPPGRSIHPPHPTSLLVTTGSPMATQQELIGAICAPCSGLLSTEAALRALASEGGYRHSSLAETRKSAARGCPLCSELVGHWKADKDAPFKDSDTIIFKFYDLTATQMCESQVPTLYPHVSRYLNARRFYGDGYRYVRGTQLFPIVADHGEVSNPHLTLHFHWLE